MIAPSVHPSPSLSHAPAVLSRIRSFQTPRLSLAVLILGLGIQSLARSRLALESTGSTAAVASLDSAIAAAQPAAGDTSARNDAPLRDLVARKRDLEVEAQSNSSSWFYAFLLGSGLVLAACVTGAQALIAHLRGEG